MSLGDDPRTTPLPFLLRNTPPEKTNDDDHDFCLQNPGFSVTELM